MKRVELMRAPFQFYEIRFLLSTIESSKRVKLLLMLLAQVGLSILDLIGVACFGLITAITVNGFESLPAQGRTSKILSFFGLLNYSLQIQVTILAVTALLVLVLKTVISIKLTKFSLFFLSRESVREAAKMLGRILREQITTINNMTLQEMLYTLTHGVNALYVNALGAFINQLSDLMLLIVLVGSMLLLNPILAIVSTTIFSLVGLILNYFMNSKVRKLGYEDSLLSIEANDLISQAISSVREIRIRNKTDFYVEKVLEKRMSLANVITELAFIPSISKYVIELTVLIAAVAVGGLSFILQSAHEAITTLAIFMASGIRIAPAVLRIQQNGVLIKSNLGNGAAAMEMLKQYWQAPPEESINVSENQFEPSIVVKQLNFSYPMTDSPALLDVNLEISPNSLTAITGPSGGGKSTLADILLGVLEPQIGRVLISGSEPKITTKLWPGKIGFVPQEIFIINGNFRDNIIMGFQANPELDLAVWECLEKSNLADFVRSFPTGLDTQVGENGSMLSGGQRQRLGIARSLFTKPSLLILDEATSSLDAVNEHQISDTLQRLKKTMTIVVIAHRLATVRNAEKVIYIDNGQILAQGNFEQVRKTIPNFNLQAQLLGL